VGTYGTFLYPETLWETEALVAILLFSMGIQNELTASISNFAVKTTHMTDLTTDLGILTSMYLKKEYRKNKALQAKRKILIAIAIANISGSIFGGVVYLKIQFLVFYVASLVIDFIICYEYYKIKLKKIVHDRRKASVGIRTALDACRLI
tara:strand:+ start:387 stop:836 length:450 start_codon:yes stop_codon:yes gene_type:complete